jgi:hypothetical protein
VKRLLLAATLVALAVTAVFALYVTPARENQGFQAVRLLYLHVPFAWLAYLAFGVTAIASMLWLVPRTRRPAWDLLAGASAEVGVVFTGLMLVVGSFWGRPTWGTWWEWDARLTSTAILFFLYLGYLALRRTGATADERHALRDRGADRGGRHADRALRSRGGRRSTSRARSSTTASRSRSTERWRSRSSRGGGVHDAVRTSCSNVSSSPNSRKAARSASSRRHRRAARRASGAGMSHNWVFVAAGYIDRR